MCYRYWGLGFHQCRYGYPDVKTLEEVVDKYATNKVTVMLIYVSCDSHVTVM